MAIIPVTRDDVEYFTIITTPKRAYSSSSLGVTGSVKVFPRLSSSEKLMSGEAFLDGNLSGSWESSNFKSVYEQIKIDARTRRFANKSITGSIDSYMQIVNNSNTKPVSTLDVEYFIPTINFTKYTLCKNNVKNLLMKYYRTDYPHAHWAYTNYHSFNFFTVSKDSQLIPTASVLLYPNISNSLLPDQAGHVSGTYCLSGAFTFDFHVNPRYNNDGIDSGYFKAGTIFHLSSSYAVSLVTGSSKDPAGLPDGFRIQLQLKHSADTVPSKVVKGNYPNDLVFLCDDNSLKYNKWHHVVIRWGTDQYAQGSGSFVIDGINRGYFSVPSGTINPITPSTASDPSVLCIGNYYEGSNTGTSAQDYFFSTVAAKRDGVSELIQDNAQDEPSTYKFKHPLKAEVHDLTIKRYYASDFEIKNSGSVGFGSSALNILSCAFYAPPFFVQESSIRRSIGDKGGVPQTPFFSIDGTTDDPFNVAMAFGVNGHYINLENFAKDFANSQFPRLLNLSASTITTTTDPIEANPVLYGSVGVPKRNLTILPCDDGSFDPNYSILQQERYTSKFRNSLGSTDWSYIYLDDLVSADTLSGSGVGQYDPAIKTFISWSQELSGISPEFAGNSVGPSIENEYKKIYSALSSSVDDASFDRGVQRNLPLTIFKTLRDPSSNQITIFNISNLYYGRRILPGSFMIVDSAISGSEGAIKLTLKDDSLGNLYRADSDGSHFTQGSVGNIFYDEGIILLKSPHLFFFGKNQYEISFKGVNNIYSTKYEILAGQGQLNSSSNPSFADSKANIRASGDPTDKESFVYITGLNFHDENMNVIAKAKVAQPIIKRNGDKLLFKVAFDY